MTCSFVLWGCCYCISKLPTGHHLHIINISCSERNKAKDATLNVYQRNPRRSYCIKTQRLGASHRLNQAKVCFDHLFLYFIATMSYAHRSFQTLVLLDLFNRSILWEVSEVYTWSYKNHLHRLTDCTTHSGSRLFCEECSVDDSPAWAFRLM